MKPNGFTLVELVLIIALLGIMAVAVVLQVPSFSRSRLNAAAQQVLSDIQYTQSYAMNKGGATIAGVQFVAGGAYTLYETVPATSIPHPLTKRTSDSVITLSNSYPGISLQNSYTVEFNALGRPTTGGGGSVTLTDGTNTKVILVTTHTGEASIQ